MCFLFFIRAGIAATIMCYTPRPSGFFLLAFMSVTILANTLNYHKSEGSWTNKGKLLTGNLFWTLRWGFYISLCTNTPSTQEKQVPGLEYAPTSTHNPPPSCHNNWDVLLCEVYYVIESGLEIIVFSLWLTLVIHLVYCAPALNLERCHLIVQLAA